MEIHDEGDDNFFMDLQRRFYQGMEECFPNAGYGKEENDYSPEVA